VHRLGYTALVKLGKSPGEPTFEKRTTMPRFAVPIIILLILIGALAFLSTRAREVPTHSIEVDVSKAPDAR
jgi:uncharacterized membrane protein YcaP (DUF421 family)